MSERRDTLEQLAREVLPDASQQEIDESLESLALSVEDVLPSATLRDRITASIDPRRRLEGFVARLADLFDLSIDRVRELLTEAESDEGCWEPSLLPGATLFHLDGGERVADADCGFVRMRPGVEFPSHGHGGDEWAIVLEGEAREDSGAQWLPGDLVHRPEGSRHSFRVVGDRPLLFAVVVRGELDFEGG